MVAHLADQVFHPIYALRRCQGRMRVQPLRGAWHAHHEVAGTPVAKWNDGAMWRGRLTGHQESAPFDLELTNRASTSWLPPHGSAMAWGRMLGQGSVDGVAQIVGAERPGMLRSSALLRGWKLGSWFVVRPPDDAQLGAIGARAPRSPTAIAGPVACYVRQFGACFQGSDGAANFGTQMLGTRLIELLHHAPRGRQPVDPRPCLSVVTCTGSSNRLSAPPPIEDHLACQKEPCRSLSTTGPPSRV